MSPKKFVLPTLLLASLLLAACSQPPSTDRAAHLLSMAAEEAANIPNTLDRFTRQLNIADTQLRTNRKTDAAKTLSLARDTLTTAKKEDFDDFHRIAGWTAISQLARSAEDRTLATKSADLALAALNDVKPETDRPQYVLSLAAELADLNGKPAAIELLNSGAGWATEIHDIATRRAALVAFTDALLNYDAFENARTALRHDPDAAWRTDTFLALANETAIIAPIPDAHYADRATAAAESKQRESTAGGRGAAAASAAPINSQSANHTTNAQFGKDVRFQNVYQQQLSH